MLPAIKSTDKLLCFMLVTPLAGAGAAEGYAAASHSPCQLHSTYLNNITPTNCSFLAHLHLITGAGAS
jgi:hypothetical protein